MNIVENILNIGIEKPFTFLHVSDTHLTLADERDNERKRELAKRRSDSHFAWGSDLKYIEEVAQKDNLLIAHTGDLIDFVSVKNLEVAKNFTDNNDVFMAAGNHEFSQYVGEAKEDADYRNQSLDLVQKSFNNDIRFSSREVNGVNFIAIDNGYYLFEQWQLDKLREEVKKGLPIILFMHTPLYSEDIYKFISDREGLPVYLMAVPEDKMEGYSPERYEQQKADEVTTEAFEFIKSNNLIKAIFAGHVHCDFESSVNENLNQYITGIETIRKVKVI